MSLQHKIVKNYVNASSFFRKKEQHQFHLVPNSQLPILAAFSAMLIAMGLVFYWHPSEGLLCRLNNLILHVGCISLNFVILSWLISVVREAQAGNHTKPVQAGLRFGFILFIVSEVLFFFAFFWAFFHYSLVPSAEIGAIWPPKGMQNINPWGLPLVNTLLLISSGVTLTCAHASLIYRDSVGTTTSYIQDTGSKFFIKHLTATIILGITFLCCQGIEYKYGLTFSWHDTVYGSIFYLTTGFHGLHVTLGTLGLAFCLIRGMVTTLSVKKLLQVDSYTYKLFHKAILLHRAINQVCIWKHVNAKKFYGLLVELHYFMKTLTTPIDIKTTYKYVLNLKAFVNWLATFGFSPQQHLGFEAAAWYWHFVDVVWLFLFATVYVWGH